MNLTNAAQKIESELKSFLGERKAIIGISGGVDSAVVTYLCTNAVGKKNVLGVLMPYGAQETEDGRLVADSLGVETREINIKDIVDGFDFLDLNRISKGNIMARVRMTILYTFSNQLEGTVVGTGNRSEIEIGYFTKHGDGGVDIEPVGDLYKTEIFELAKLLGVPKKIIAKKPSAELWGGQTDEDELGITYSKLDAVLKGETKKGKVYKRVQKLVKNSEHKKQTPPIIKLR